MAVQTSDSVARREKNALRPSRVSRGGPRVVTSVAPFLRPLTRVEQHKLRSQFDTVAKRELIIDVFEHMGRDTTFMADIPRSFWP